MEISDKELHNSKMEKYVYMINEYILQNRGVRLRNVSYAVPIEGNLAYYDYPYGPEVEILNHDLANNKDFQQKDENIYEKFYEKQKDIDKGYVLYSYGYERDDNEQIIGINVTDVKQNIIQGVTINNEDLSEDDLINFLPIMIISGEVEFDYNLKAKKVNSKVNDEEHLLMFCKQLGVLGEDDDESTKVTNIINDHTIICSLAVTNLTKVIDEDTTNDEGGTKVDNSEINKLYHLIFELLETFFESPVVKILNAEIKKNQLRTAIISILVDSYAHNISAHSMVALEAWFRTRSELLEKKINKNGGTKKLSFPSLEIESGLLASISEQAAAYYSILGLADQTNTNEYLSLADIIRLNGDKIEELFTGKSVNNDPNQIDKEKVPYEEEHKLPVPIDYALWQFFRFMKGKAAFWSGVTRDLPFGGEYISLYDLLYKHLAENPLYLGTIVHSEGINKLKIKIGLDKNFNPQQPEEITFYDFLQIDTSLIKGDQKANARNESNNPFNCFDLATDRGEAINYSKYGFIQFGKDFKVIRDLLSAAKKAFLPGGLVGIHSFLTIIENTIRNVKHYKHHIINAGENFDDLTQNGVTLLLTFEHMDLFGEKLAVNFDETININHKLYRVGVALGHKLTKAAKSAEDALIHKLYSEVTDEQSGKPKLGGTSQDKICAAMLLNNKFISVETVKTARDYFYYPWVQPKQLSYEDLLSGKTDDLAFTEKLSENINSNSIKFNKQEKENIHLTHHKNVNSISGGFVFKFFNLWASDEVIRLNETSNDKYLKSENFARFKFGILKSNKLNAYLEGLTKNKEERQIFRLIETDETNINSHRAYQLWNESIFETNNEFKTKIFELPTSFQENVTLEPLYKFNNKTQAYCNNEDGNIPYNQYTLVVGDMIYAHGDNPDNTKVLNYRSHGVFVEEFAKNKGINYGIKESKRLEFIETVLMDIKIWDDRIFERVKKNNFESLPKYVKSLRLHFYQEMDNIQSELLTEEQDIHRIYVVHLSFIEYLKKANDTSRNSDKNPINWFVKHYIASNNLNFKKLTICIISGRGNAEWFDKINSTYTSFIIYRPVESLLDAIEDALTYGDDFQLKYNICKSIIGS